MLFEVTRLFRNVEQFASTQSVISRKSCRLKAFIIYQYSKTNVMHFLFSLLRIMDLYMFRALLAHPQEALHHDTWYTACVLWQLAAPGLGGASQTALGIWRTCYVSWLHQDWEYSNLVQPTDITRTQYTKCHLLSTS
jgi:hypothetical protein